MIGDEVEGDEEREVRRQDPAAHRGREAGARAVARVRHPGEVPDDGPAVRGEVDEGCGGDVSGLRVWGGGGGGAGGPGGGGGGGGLGGFFSRAYRLPLPSQVPGAELQYY